MNLYAAAPGPRRGTPSADDVQSLLNSAGLHSTRQRIALASLLLRTANRPVTAEILYEEAHESQCFVLRATVCNALRHFERAGLLSVGCPARSSLELHYPRLHHHAAAAEADAPLDRPLVLARKRSRDLRAPAAGIEPAAPPSPPTPFPAFTA